ncbi:AmmeMemoRadiSam system protein A [Trueperella sp.]|uniref:AmmeMemoRadiSam system protein A n=1 Tax=Trueperella sp. TaxID=2699835 RepID=UPI003736314F
MSGHTQHLPDNAGDWLLPLARTAIAGVLGADPGPRGEVPTPVPEWMESQGATFVTLTQNGHLRGCIGSLLAHRALVDDLRYNAVASATQDYRFPTLTADELARTDIEVSVLSAPTPIEFSTRAELEEQLRPGVDGLILTVELRRATFLPQVWEQLPKPALFIDQLLAKAGVSPDRVDWASDRVTAKRYTVTDWAE